jgi:hypothetical protein
MRYELGIIGLWAIAIVATIILTSESKVFTYLGPVYLICMVGSIIILRALRKEINRK